MLDGTASYPNIPKGGVADSLAPYVTAYLPTSLACGASVGFQVTIAANEGSWSASFNHGVGSVLPGGGTAIDESFTAGIPATWTVIDGGAGGSAGATTWTTANPGARSIAPPMAAPAAIVDSDRAGSTLGITQDEMLITPAMNLAAATAVTLTFDQYFLVLRQSLRVADVDVRSAATKGLGERPSASRGVELEPGSPCARHHGAVRRSRERQVRFALNAHYDGWWQLDNVGSTTDAPCAQSWRSRARSRSRSRTDRSAL
jgi:hypothetical protein